MSGSLKARGLFCLALLMLLLPSCKRAAPPTTKSGAMQAVVTGGSSVVAQQDQAHQSSPIDLVVAVDGTVLNCEQLRSRVDRAVAGLGAGLSTERLTKARTDAEHQAIGIFIAETLLKHEAARLQIQVDEQDVAAEVKKATESMGQAGTPLAEKLKARGITLEMANEEVRQSLTVAALMKRALPVLPPAKDREVADFFKAQPGRYDQPEQAHVHHVLIAVGASESEESVAIKHAKAEACRTRLLQGADFATVARESSDCPSAAQGGDLGNVVRRHTGSTFEEAVFSQPLGSIGEVVRSLAGFHVIRVDERMAAVTRTLDEVRDTVRQDLQAERQRAQVDDYVNTLRSKAKIMFGQAARFYIETEAPGTIGSRGE